MPTDVPAENALANDVPVDVNFNAIIARDQALTIQALGKNYESNADIRNKIAQHCMGIHLAKASTP